MRSLAWMVFALCLPGLDMAASVDPAAPSQIDDNCYGIYRAADGHIIGIDHFITDSNESAVLFSDYKSGVIRRVFPISRDEWVMGPASAVQSPRELTIRFVRDATGAVTNLLLHPANGPDSVAKRVPLHRQAVTISSGPVTLAGTLIMPTGEEPHAGIVLLHGSGPLTRYSFGPYPHFFASLGLAVLIFDKRGTGDSTGTRLDASTGALESSPKGYFYPDDLLEDALAAFRLLQSRQEIDPKQVGFWGSSEGGMLATQAAAHNKDVAFAIDSSGFMGPLWQTLHYQAGALARERGVPDAQVEEALAFSALWMRVARTGTDYQKFIEARDEARREDKDWLLNWRSGDFSSLKQMRWDWDHTLSFNPLPALKTVTCPVLGIWGERDPLTDAPRAAKSMRAALTEAGNKDFTTKIIPDGSHSLMELPGKRRMAPGVFDTLRAWLRDRVRTSNP
jgi:pimeloyl-ACP methyl ester carboxylesterase